MSQDEWTPTERRGCEKSDVSHPFPAQVYGQDSPALQKHKYVKAGLIEQIMKEHDWNPNDVLFVDDSARNVGECDRRGTCDTLRVSNKEGLDKSDCDRILERARRR